MNIFGNLVFKYEHVIQIQLEQILETRMTECLLHFILETAGNIVKLAAVKGSEMER